LGSNIDVADIMFRVTVAFQLCVIAHVLGYKFWSKSPEPSSSLPVIPLHECFKLCCDICDKLFVRVAYQEMFEILFTCYEGKQIGVAVVLGTPGVGKTFFLFYMLYMFKAKGITVVVSMGTSFFLILDKMLPRMVSSIKIIDSYCIDNKDCVYLHDPLDSNESAAITNARLTIVTSSVDRRNLKSVKNRSKKVLYMPIWNLEELERCYSLCYQSLFSTKPNFVKKRFYYWGGSARNVFTVSDTSLHDDLQSIIKEGDSVIELITRIDSPIYGPDSTQKFQWLHHMIPSADYCKVASVQWPSPYIRKSVLMQLPKIESSLLNRIKLLSEASYIKSGNLYGDYVSHHLQSGVSKMLVASPYQSDGTTDDITISYPTKYALFSNADVILNTVKDTLYLPLEKNKETIDMIFPPYMLQATVAKEHSMKKKGIEAVKKAFPNVDTWTFCFIMPIRKKESFKIKSPIRDMKIYIAHVDYEEEVKFCEVHESIKKEEDSPS
jgi:hypothetical protein